MAGNAPTPNNLFNNDFGYDEPDHRYALDLDTAQYPTITPGAYGPPAMTFGGRAAVDGYGYDDYRNGFGLQGRVNAELYELAAATDRNFVVYDAHRDGAGHNTDPNYNARRRGHNRGSTGNGSTGPGDDDDDDTGSSNDGSGSFGHDNDDNDGTGHGNNGYGSIGHGNDGNNSTGHGITGHGNTANVDAADHGAGLENIAHGATGPVMKRQRNSSANGIGRGNATQVKKEKEARPFVSHTPTYDTDDGASDFEDRKDLKIPKINKDGVPRKPRHPRPKLLKWNDNDWKNVVLGIIWACGETGVQIPFDQAAQIVGERCTAGALQQAILKLRGKQIAEGYQIPALKMAWTRKNRNSSTHSSNTNTTKITDSSDAKLASGKKNSTLAVGHQSHIITLKRPSRELGRVNIAEPRLLNSLLTQSHNGYGNIPTTVFEYGNQPVNNAVNGAGTGTGTGTIQALGVQQDVTSTNSVMNGGNAYGLGLDQGIVPSNDTMGSDIFFNTGTQPIRMPGDGAGRADKKIGMKMRRGAFDYYMKDRHDHVLSPQASLESANETLPASAETAVGSWASNAETLVDGTTFDSLLDLPSYANGSMSTDIYESPLFGPMSFGEDQLF